MASSNASLEGTGRARPQDTKGHGDPEVTVTREQERASSPSVRERRHDQRTTKDRIGDKRDREEH